MSASAAIFDLDRTLIGGASGPVLSSALVEVGLRPDRHVPGEGLIFKVFDLVGETWPSMMLTRQMARLARGWEQDRAIEAGRIAAASLIGLVQPWAALSMAEHRAAGRKLVLATTTPHDLIAATAEELGFDAVIATRYGLDEQGRYDGSIDGEFVWSRGKHAAVRAWAREADVDLSESYAYSDSWYDQHLLGAVGHPTAVNPDPRLALMAPLRRWPIVWFDVPPGIPKLGGILEPQEALMLLARPELFPYLRLEVRGWRNIPQEGPAILVGNHRSYFDPLAIGLTIAKRGRPVRFLGKKEVFDAPVVGQLARAMGGIRVERGTGSSEPLQEAARALAAGELVALMPQGTIPRGPAFFDPVLKGRWGAARLAAMSGVPVIPMGLWGTEQVWPRSARVPNVLNVLDPPRVQVSVGRPIEVAGDDAAADTEAIMAGIVNLLPSEAREQRTPTAQELAATYPPGWSGDPDAEQERRPGTD